MTDRCGELGFESDLDEDDEKKKKKKDHEYVLEPEWVSFIGPDGPVMVCELDEAGVVYSEPDPDDPIWVEWEVLKHGRLGIGVDAVRHAMRVS